MFKPSNWLLCSLILPSISYAHSGDREVSIGIHGGYFNRDLRIENARTGTSMSDVNGGSMADNLNSSSELGFSLSKRINEKVRLSLNFERSEAKQSSYNADPSNINSTNNHLDYRLEQHQLRVAIDYMMPLSRLDNTHVYIGGHMGVSHADYGFERSYFLGWDNSYGAEGSSWSEVIGLQAGIEYYFSAQLSGELGMLYSYYHHDFTANRPTQVSYIVQQHQLQIKSQVKGMLGLKYHF